MKKSLVIIGLLFMSLFVYAEGQTHVYVEGYVMDDLGNKYGNMDVHAYMDEGDGVFSSSDRLYDTVVSELSNGIHNGYYWLNIPASDFEVGATMFIVYQNVSHEAIVTLADLKAMNYKKDLKIVEKNLEVEGVEAETEDSMEETSVDEVTEEETEDTMENTADVEVAEEETEDSMEETSEEEVAEEETEDSMEETSDVEVAEEETEDSMEETSDVEVAEEETEDSMEDTVEEEAVPEEETSEDESDAEKDEGMQVTMPSIGGNMSLFVGAGVVIILLLILAWIFSSRSRGRKPDYVVR
ncbi:hypothetical protein H6504_04850 [Candidatus Woesearchaeota archaeon]|nr:hypothetical protein [Candidatus Woesearchaeota archaeon]